MTPLVQITALCVALAGLTPRPGLADDTRPATQAQVHALLSAARAEHGFPGATAAYALPDGTVITTAVGLADVEAGTAMTPDSRMLAASIGKTLVGALILSLEDDGTLRRRDPVSRYLGDRDWFARLPNAPDLTIGQLLTHTAGLPDHVHMAGVARQLVARARTGPVAPEDAIAFVLDTPPLHHAGRAWAYSDTGYLLLGLVIEAASGHAFYTLVQGRFLDPLALTQTGPSATPDLSGLAIGYTVPDNLLGLPARTMSADGALLWSPAIEWTGGGFVSTSGDLARWGHALFSGAALPDPYLDRLLDRVPVHPEAPGLFYGAGVGIYGATEFGPVYGHGGWLPGYVSSLRHYADHGITIAFQINSDVGVVDDSTDLVPELEAALAALLIGPVASD